MTPTNKLRFVERGERNPHLVDNYYQFVKVRVLQQWWEPHYPGSAIPGEWRDVPMEEEQ